MMGDISEEGFEKRGFVVESKCLDSVASSREEEFLACVLVLLKNEDAAPEINVEDGRLDLSHENCSGERWRSVLSCPKSGLATIVKLSDEDNSSLDGEAGSSSLEEESGNRYHSDGSYSSDEGFGDIKYRRARSKIRAKNLAISSNTVATSRSKRQSKVETAYSKDTVRIRASKRKIDNDLSDAFVQPKRKYSKQRKVIKGIEMFWNPPTESYGIAKPKSPEQYEFVIRWSLSQLPKQRGTMDQVFAGVKEYGWPELKKGNTREALICKNAVAKILLEQFVESSTDEKGEPIYCLLHSQNPQVEEETNETMVDQDSSLHICSKHSVEDGCPSACSFRRDFTDSPRGHQMEHRAGEKPQKEETKPKRESRKRTSLLSEEIADEEWWANADESTHIISTPSPRKKPNTTKKTTPSTASKENGRGRRWVRFACEKHRREHARCPDNCPMRKKSYTEEETKDNEMDIEPHQLQSGSIGSAEDEIIDEVSTEA